MQKRRITIQHVSVMHIFTRMSWNLQWNLHTYAISNLQSTTSHMSNVVHNRGTPRFITKPRMDICKIKSSNHRTIESIINSQHFFVLMHRLIERHPPYFKNRQGPQKETGEIGVCRRGFPGQMKQQAGSPKVKLPNRRTPDWQMKLYPGEFCNPLDNIILQNIQGLIQKFY